MDIRVLKYFLAVAREGSITKAANVLHVTQPTLSRQLQDLEKELKHKLFIRGQHSVSLTTEGHILRQRAEEIVDMAEKTKNEFLSTKDVIKGTVYLGSGESDAISLITDIVKNIQMEYKEIKFDFLSGNADDLCEKLDKGLLDFAVLIEPVNISKYDYISDINNLISALTFIIFIIIILATYNLFYNAGLMVNSCVGYALTLDKLANVTSISNLTFRPLSPKLESSLNIVWKKAKLFSPAAKVFLEKLKKNFDKFK